MADAIHHWRQVLDCARRATKATDEKERDLLFEMLEAGTNLAVVEADVYEASRFRVDGPHIALIDLC